MGKIFDRVILNEWRGPKVAGPGVFDKFLQEATVHLCGRTEKYTMEVRVLLPLATQHETWILSLLSCCLRLFPDCPLLVVHRLIACSNDKERNKTLHKNYYYYITLHLFWSTNEGYFWELSINS